MVLGPQGLFGVGSAEVIVVVAVGYFLLGPEDLFKLAKEIGKLVASVRRSLAESAAEWQATMGNEVDFKEIRDIQNTARELQEAFNFRSNRYLSEWRDFSSGAAPVEPFSPLPASQLDVDEWNKNVMATGGVAADSQAAALAAFDDAPIDEALVTAPPELDPVLAQKKDLALQELEREYAIKLKELQLEYDFKRGKADIDFAASEADLDKNSSPLLQESS